MRNFWYSVNYGLVHFVFVSTEHDYSPNSPQMEFLEKVPTLLPCAKQVCWTRAWSDLTPRTWQWRTSLRIGCSGRGSSLWAIAPCSAAPPSSMASIALVLLAARVLTWCDADRFTFVSLGGMIPRAFEQLFLKYKVDVYYAGHIHTYERHFSFLSPLPSSTITFA